MKITLEFLLFRLFSSVLGVTKILLGLSSSWLELSNALLLLLVFFILFFEALFFKKKK